MDALVIEGSAMTHALALLRRRLDDIAVGRRLPDDVDLALRATGVNRMLLPRRLGGLETPTAEAFTICERIAAVDGSAGWCTVIGAGSNVFAGYLPEDGAREVFADPDRSSATMFAPLGTLDEDDDGTVHLDGRWPFVSNCLHAEWIGLVARSLRDADALPRLVFVPAEDVDIEDTWDVVGLRGTGSHHVSAHHLRVEARHTCPFVGGPWPDGPLWRRPVFSVILPLLAAVPVGIARGALDELARQIREGRSGVRRGDLAHDPLAMSEFAAADSRLVAARAAVLELAREAEDVAAAGDVVDRRLLARTYLANLHATDTAVEVTAVAHRLGGGAAAYADSPLLRALGDVHAARQHFQFAHEHRITLGQIVAGCDMTYQPYIS